MVPTLVAFWGHSRNSQTRIELSESGTSASRQDYTASANDAVLVRCVSNDVKARG